MSLDGFLGDISDDEVRHRKSSSNRVPTGKRKPEKVFVNNGDLSTYLVVAAVKIVDNLHRMQLVFFVWAILKYISSESQCAGKCPADVYFEECCFLCFYDEMLAKGELNSLHVAII